MSQASEYRELEKSTRRNEPSPEGQQSAREFKQMADILEGMEELLSDGPLVISGELEIRTQPNLSRFGYLRFHEGRAEIVFDYKAGS